MTLAPNPQPTTNQPAQEESTLSYLVSAAGFILGISYPVLALSAGVRGIYQLFFDPETTYYLPPLLSAIAGLCYLLAAIGFFYRHRWAWRLSVVVLAFEMGMVLLVGSTSLINPALIGRTVWHHFGIDYALFPLIMPLLGLLWLFRPDTRRAYGVSPGE